MKTAYICLGLKWLQVDTTMSSQRSCYPSESSCLEQSSRFPARDKVEEGDGESSQFCHLDNLVIWRKKLAFCFTCSWLCWLTTVLHGGSRLELVRRTFIFLRVGSSSIFTPLVISSDYDFHVFSSSPSKVKWPGCCCWNIHPIEVEQESPFHKTNLEKVLRSKSQVETFFCILFVAILYERLWRDT